MPARRLTAAWLVLLAAPAFPAAPARLTLDDLFAQEGESDVAVSPSGRYIAVVVQQKDNDVLALIDTTTGNTAGLTRIGRKDVGTRFDAHVTTVWWKNEERLLFRVSVSPAAGVADYRLNEQLVMKALGEFVESRIGPGFGLNLENHQ